MREWVYLAGCRMELLNQAGLIVMPAIQSADGSLRPDTCRSITDLVFLSLGCSAIVSSVVWHPPFPEFLSSIFFCLLLHFTHFKQREA